MSIVRIVCKAESLQSVPDAHDTHIYLVRDDGTEVEIPGVTRVVWTVACDGEAARARLELDGVEVDVTGLVRDKHE